MRNMGVHILYSVSLVCDEDSFINIYSIYINIAFKQYRRSQIHF